MTDSDSQATPIKSPTLAVVTLDSYMQMQFMFCLLVSGYFCIAYLSQPIVEAHAFRQTQTALTAFYLAKNGFSLDYWTPVLGQGWSIPFELPLYQEIVALVSRALGTSLSETGRLTSYLFLVLCCVPIYSTFKLLGVSEKNTYFALTLFLGCPHYLFWGSTFMIETTALFFTLCFIHFATRIVISGGTLLDQLMTAFWLSLSLLQKATVALPVLVVFGPVLIIHTYRKQGLSATVRSLGKELLVVAPCLVLLAVWTHHTDMVKLDNPLAAQLSSSNLATWNFGTLAQRFEGGLWITAIWQRMLCDNLFGLAGLVAILVALLMRNTTKTKSLVLVLLLLCVAPVMIFTNLYQVHDYYITENLVFAELALALAIMTLCDRFLPHRPRLQALLTLLLLLLNLGQFALGNMILRTMQIPTERAGMYLGRYVKAHTAPDDVIIWFGFDWSGEPAYFSERKSLTVPYWLADGADVIVHTNKYLSTAPSLIVLCPNPDYSQEYQAIRRRFTNAEVTALRGCQLFSLPAPGHAPPWSRPL